MVASGLNAAARTVPLTVVEGAVAWAMVESSPDGMLLTDENGVISLANAQIGVLFGYDRGEVLGCTIEKLLPERHRQDHTAHRANYREAPWPRRMGSDVELLGRRSDGTEFPVEVSLSPITTDDGVRIVATVRDVTERVNLEARNHAVIKMIGGAHDGVFMFAPEALTFIYVNHGAEVQLGYTRDELLSMSPLHIELEFSETSFRALLEPLVTGRVDSHSFTTVHRRKDGTELPVEIILDYPPAAGAGKPRLVIALVRDITERVQFEEAFRRSEAALRLFDDRERLARDLHDLVIQRLFAAGMGLQAIHSAIVDPRAAQRIVETVTELDLTISELRSAIFELSTVADQSVAAGIRDIVEHASIQLGFTPLLTIDGDLEVITSEVGEQLVPVLTEALSNVARHARASRVDIAITIEDGAVQMSVADNGVGIDADAPHGSGLDNLHNRASRHGGSLTIESGADNGTTLVWAAPR